MAVLAAAYALGLAKSHAFVDGDKRIRFTSAALFLSMNGFQLDAPERCSPVQRGRGRHSPGSSVALNELSTLRHSDQRV